jgi:hypothetical protein
VKKIAIVLAPIIILVVAFGCGKDHDAPTYGVYSNAEAPENLVATYDPDNDVVNLLWSMADMDGVTDFFVSVSDSSVFDLGTVTPFYVNTTNTVSPFAFEYDATTYVMADSTIMYFTVSAVYDNETFNKYIGPRAVIDSAMVKH